MPGEEMLQAEIVQADRKFPVFFEKCLSAPVPRTLRPLHLRVPSAMTSNIEDMDCSVKQMLLCPLVLNDLSPAFLRFAAIPQAPDP